MPTITEGRPGAEGRVALVTGGSRGIGRAICQALAADGMAIVVAYHHRRHDALETAASIRSGGGTAAVARVEVTRGSSVSRLVEVASLRFGRLDVLVNNAALTDRHRPWQEVATEDWDATMATNARGAYLLFRAAYPLLRASGSGRVINIGSVTFDLGKRNRVQYVASKGALVGFTRSLAREVGADGITVNCVSPGAIETEREIELFPDRAVAERELLSVQAIKRLGRPSDVGAAVAFLASERASFITGQTLLVDGGWVMR
jgi:3-oxoacyl-[acyl-carrier protein] reductase